MPPTQVAFLSVGGGAGIPNSEFTIPNSARSSVPSDGAKYRAADHLLRLVEAEEVEDGDRQVEDAGIGPGDLLRREQRAGHEVARHRVVARPGPRVEAMVRHLQAWEKMVSVTSLDPDLRTEEDLDEDTLKQLKSLGYIQ